MKRFKDLLTKWIMKWVVKMLRQSVSTLGATLIETRDHQGMERFFPVDLKQKDCCSRSLIAFYGVKQSQMSVIDLSYKETSGLINSTIKECKP
jgi:hypothetical protein